MSYPVAWRGQTYSLHDLTIGVKNEFVKWAKARLTQEGIENLGQRPDLLTSYLSAMYGEVWWGDGGMSKPVHSVLHSPAGVLQFNRLLFGDSARLLSDIDLRALIADKDREQDEADKRAEAAGVQPPYPPANDYAAAMRLITEHADPKKAGAGTGAGHTAGTSSTGTT